MAVEFVAIAEYKTDGGTSILMTAPVGTSVGDLLIAYISKDDDVDIDETGSYGDWNMVFNNIANGQTCLYIAWKFAEAGDAAQTTDYTWNGDSEDWLGEILCYSGTDTTTPVHASGIGTGTSATPTAPSVAFTSLTVGSLVLQVMGIDQDDNDYVVPSQLTSRFNAIQANDIGGAGGEKVTFTQWVSPTGYDDPDSKWTDEVKAYDENTDQISRAYTPDSIPTGTWSSYVVYTHSSITCDKVRLWAKYSENYINAVSVDVYYSSAWHNIYEGAFTNLAWVEKAIGSIQTVTAMRMKFYANSITDAWVVEVDFGEATSLEGTGETGTAIFTATSRPWAAATVIIEAVGVAKQYLLSTAAIVTSMTSALSRGVTEALTSTSAITSSITGRLTRIVDLISTSAIVTSITSLLTRGVALVSTSNIVTSITGSLSRGVTETLNSTSNIASSITSSLSRGVTQALVSTANMATSVSSILSRGITAGLNSTSNIVVSITSVLSRGITEALTSTSNIAVSIVSVLSRGIKETLSSTANIAISIVAELTKEGAILLNSTAAIATSITSALSRGITETLTSTSVITTLMIGNLSRGIKEVLTSTVSITTSITSVLSRGITEALYSTVNIVTSITAKLSPTIIFLTSTVNIATSILARLRYDWWEEIKPTIDWVEEEKNEITWTKEEKSEINWDKEDKGTIDWTEEEKGTINWDKS